MENERGNPSDIYHYVNITLLVASSRTCNM